MNRPSIERILGLGLALVLVSAAACKRDTPPVARPMPPADTATEVTDDRPVRPPDPVRESSVPAEPLADSSVSSKSLDDINRAQLLKPAHFDYDSAEINSAAQAVLDANAAVLKQNPSWTVTIEGHTDERGTAEYNLALGERRAVAARTYLISLGISADRLRTVSYGKEFPFDPGKDEAAYAKNRRAHFVVTGQ